MKKLQNYFREIKKELPCGGCKRRKILRDLRQSVDDFLAENPEATYDRVVELFGTPQQIADSCVAEMPPREVQKKLKIKRWIIGIVAGAAACALLIWLISVGIMFMKEIRSAGGYHVEGSVVVVEENEQTED